MRVSQDFGQVRIVYLGEPMDYASNILVQTLEADGTWKRYAGFNSLSDDYAYTNAREAADRAIASLAKQAAESITG
jgi:hypothetical protein